MTKITRAITLGVATAALLTAAHFGVAWAETPVVRQVTVDHADLDLTTAAGLATVRHRAEAAATEACGPVEKHHDTALSGTYEACYQAAMSSVMAAVDRAASEARASHQMASVPSTAQAPARN